MSAHHLTQTDVYDRFLDYVTQKLKKSHPNITLQNFSKIGKGPTHLIIALQHVQTGVDKEFFEIVEAFKENTFVKTEQDKTGTAIFKVHVPWKSKEEIPQYHHRQLSSPSRPPNTMFLVLYGFLAMLLLLLAVGKTRAQDWQFILR